MPPTRDLAHNLGMCSDWESNQWSFGSQAGTQSTKPCKPWQAFAEKLKSQVKATCLLHLAYLFPNIFFRLLLPISHETISPYLVLSRYTLTHTDTFHSMHKILLFILIYPAIPALPPPLSFGSVAQTLLLTYPKYILPCLLTKRTEILFRRAIYPDKIFTTLTPLQLGWSCNLFLVMRYDSEKVC